MKRFFLILALLVSFSCAKKLVILDPASVEIAYMLGAEDQIAAISTLATAKIWPEDKTSKLKSVGTYTRPNLELVVELKPDLVITSFHSIGVNEDLKKFDIPTLTLKADSIQSIYDNITKMGEATGKEEKAKEVIASIKEKIEKFKNSSLAGKKAVVIFAATPIMAFSSKTLPGNMLDKLGLVNIADKLEGSTPVVSSEFILANDPDFIIVIGEKDAGENFLKANPILKKTNAAKNSKILGIPSSIMLRGTPRINESIEKIYNTMK